MNANAEPRHPIQVVARRTGLSADVLRAWERRYGAVAPTRSDSARRLYSDADVERLALLRQATEAGRSIGQLAHLSVAELQRLVSDDRSADVRAAERAPAAGASDLERLLQDAIAAVEQLDPHALQATLNLAGLTTSPAELVDRVLVPLMRTIGDRWRAGTLGVAHEHLASPIVRSRLAELAFMRDVPRGGPSLLVATPARQVHELGALAVAATAAAVGWQVTYLGADLPAADIAQAAARTGAQAVALSLTYPVDDPGLAEELRTLRRLLPPGAVLLAGGAAAPAYLQPLADVGALVLGDMASLRAALLSLRGEHGLAL